MDKLTSNNNNESDKLNNTVSDVVEDKDKNESVHLNFIYDKNKNLYKYVFKNKCVHGDSFFSMFDNDELLKFANIAPVEQIDKQQQTTTVTFKEINGEPLSNRKFLVKLSIIQAIYIVKQIALYLKHIHQKSYVSHTLRPDHIVYDLQLNKVTIIPALHKANEKCCSDVIDDKYQCAYASPQEIEKIEKIDYNGDYYKLGLIFYELIKKSHLIDYFNLSIKQIAEFHLSDKQIHISISNKCTNKVLNKIVSRLLTRKIHIRYTTGLELIDDLTFIEGNIDDESLDNQRIIQHRINSYVYSRDLYNKTFNVIDKITTNNIRNIVIGGYSGYGKSKYISSIKTKCFAADYTFLKGKYEQYNTDLPYVAIKQCLSGLKNTNRPHDIKRSLQELKDSISSASLRSLYYLCPDVFDYFDIEVENVESENNRQLFYNSLLLLLKKYP